MAVHFAAARSTTRSHVARVLGPVNPRVAANDTGPIADPLIPADSVLVETLRHFAVHGLASAGEAQRLAERAHRDGDSAAFRRWCEVLRLLDGRRASLLTHRLDRQSDRTPA